MKSPYQFIVIDTDPVNCFISCRAIMQATGSAVIQTFQKHDEAFRFIRENSGSRDRRIIIFNRDDARATLGEFMSGLEQFENKIRSNTSVYILSSLEEPMTKVPGSESSFINGYLKRPLAIENVRAKILTE
jgi:hypothetical protein